MSTLEEKFLLKSSREKDQCQDAQQSRIETCDANWDAGWSFYPPWN